MVKFWLFDEVVETTDNEETVRKSMSEDYFIEGLEWGFMGKPTEKEQKVRKRKSYQYFQDMHKFFQERHSNEEILKKLYEIRDTFRGWGTVTHSQYAKESLELFISDLRGGRR